MVVILELGDKAKPLSEQVPLQADAVAQFQADADAISRLKARKVCSAFEATRIRERLVRQIERAVKTSRPR